MVASTIILAIKYTKRKRKYVCANCVPVDVSHVKPGSAELEINKLKDNTNKIKGINTLLWEENQKLREENTIIKSSNKVDKTNNTKKINELET